MQKNIETALADLPENISHLFSHRHNFTSMALNMHQKYKASTENKWSCDLPSNDIVRCAKIASIVPLFLIYR